MSGALHTQDRSFVSCILRRTFGSEAAVGSVKSNYTINNIYGHEFVRRRVLYVTLCGITLTSFVWIGLLNSICSTDQLVT
jgi:hypothetical protein